MDRQVHPSQHHATNFFSSLLPHFFNDYESSIFVRVDLFQADPSLVWYGEEEGEFSAHATQRRNNNLQ